MTETSPPLLALFFTITRWFLIQRSLQPDGKDVEQRLLRLKGPSTRDRLHGAAIIGLQMRPSNEHSFKIKQGQSDRKALKTALHPQMSLQVLGHLRQEGPFHAEDPQATVTQRTSRGALVSFLCHYRRHAAAT